MKVDCDYPVYCKKKLEIPSGSLLADALRAAGWKHTRLPRGKSTNICPVHGSASRVGDWGGD